MIFTKVDLGARDVANGGTLLADAVSRFPVIEIHLDIGIGRAEAAFPPVSKPLYEGVQVPVF